MAQDPFLAWSGRVDSPVASYTPPQGNLPFGGGGGQMTSIGSTTPASAGADYSRAYSDALAMNQKNYQNIYSGYQNLLAQQQERQAQVQARYDQLNNAVQQGIANMGASRSQEINDQYTQAGGAATQNLINAGLGNTTVTSSVARGLEADRNKAQTALTDQLAGLKASYASNLGLAAAGYASQAEQANSGLVGRQLDWMNSVNANYPNAGLYAQLAQMAGAAQEANRNRAALGGGGQSPNFGLARNPGTGGGLYRNPDLFAPTYDVGGDAGYGGYAGGYGPGAGAGAYAYGNYAPSSLAESKGYSGDVSAGYGRDDNALAGVIGYAGANYAQPSYSDLGGGYGMDASGYVYGSY